MISTKFASFLLERLSSLILESNIIYSDDFRKILSDISSPISQELLNIENKDFKVSSNFFDVSDTKDSITFIPDRKAQEIISKESLKVIYNGEGGFLRNDSKSNETIFNALGYKPSSNFRPEDGDEGEVVAKSISPTSGKIYVLVRFPQGECVINQSGLDYSEGYNKVWSLNRQSIRVGRGIRALLSSTNNKFTDSQIEEFVNKYKSAYDKKNDVYRLFEIVDGEEISKWYYYKNYEHNGNGTLGNSCMASAPPTYFSIYTKNPDVCSLVILKTESGNKIKGRALLWTLSDPENIKFLDRIYTNDDSDIELFKSFAKSKGWYYKKYNGSSSSTSIISPSDTELAPNRLSVYLNSGKYNHYPYLDTLKYYREADGRLSTDDEKGSYDYALEDTEGGFICTTCDGDGEIECRECEGRGMVECEECDGSGTVECEECGGSKKVKCEECEGKGSVESECEECGGEGEIDGEECENCEGTGEVKEDCPECQATGYSDCPNCGGEGKTECKECDGEGEIECEECNGRGTIDCPSCENR